MKTKSDVIREAWGIHYNRLKKFIDSDGKANNNDLPDDYFHACIFVLDGTYDKIYEGNELYFRPKSLQGIENNEGWISINSEEDLPENTIKYHVIICGTLTTAYYRGSNRWIVYGNDYPKTTEKHKITHWQPITKPNPPLHD